MQFLSRQAAVNFNQATVAFKREILKLFQSRRQSVTRLGDFLIFLVTSFH